MMEDKSEIGPIDEEFKRYCEEYLQDMNEDEDLPVLLGKASYNIQMMETIAKGLIRAKIDQEMDRRRKEKDKTKGR